MNASTLYAFARFPLLPDRPEALIAGREEIIWRGSYDAKPPAPYGVINRIFLSKQQHNNMQKKPSHY